MWQNRRQEGDIKGDIKWTYIAILDTMDPEELRAYLSDIRQELEAMDEDEPEDETSEEFVDWAEEHEALEDLVDEIIDRLEALGEALE